MTAPGTSWLNRSLRRFVLGSGPLKRRCDRVQMLGRFVVVLSFLVAPPLAVATATATTTHLETVAAAEETDRHRGSAVLLEDAPAATPVGIAYDESPLRTVPARAGWAGPGGAPREGVVLVRPRTRVGTAVPIWLDGEGNLARAPLDRTGIPAAAMAMGALPLIGVPVAVWTLYAVLCYGLDAHRQRRWALGWAAVEREWGTRL